MVRKSVLPGVFAHVDVIISKAEFCHEKLCLHCRLSLYTYVSMLMKEYSYIAKTQI